MLTAASLITVSDRLTRRTGARAIFAPYSAGVPLSIDRLVVLHYARGIGGSTRVSRRLRECGRTKVLAGKSGWNRFLRLVPGGELAACSSSCLSWDSFYGDHGTGISTSACRFAACHRTPSPSL